MGNIFRSFGFFAAFALAAAAPVVESARAGSAPNADWWNSAWSARYHVRVRAQPSGLAGDDVGWVAFHHQGLALPDGADIRVVANGGAVDGRVIDSGRGDHLIVCFALRPGTIDYHVYLGNAKADAIEKKWFPRRGLLLKTFKFRGGNPNNWNGMKGIVAQSTEAFGAGFAPNVFHGWNPFGPSDAFVSVYKGTLVAPAAGEYEFATTSDDASFLFVDEKPVVQFPGWHGAPADARHRATVRLEKGLHDFSYFHVTGGGDAIMVAAWQPPGADKIVPIPPEAFAPVTEGSVVGLERRGQTGYVSDVQVTSRGEAWADDRCLVRIGFKAFGPAADSTAWDFGDGQIARGATVDHVYLKSGPRSIRATFKGSAGGPDEVVVQRVFVDRVWDRPLASQAENPARYWRDHLARYDLTKLTPEDLAMFALAASELGTTDDRVRVAEACLAVEKLPDETLYEQAVFLAKTLADIRRNPQAALAAINTALPRLERNRVLHARLIRERGDIYFYYLNDLDQALSSYSRVIEQYTGLPDHVVRITKIKIGDIYRTRGDGETARARYREAEALRLHQTDPVLDRIRKGAILQQAEEYLKREKTEDALEQVEVYEWEFPAGKLEGPSSLLRARIALAQIPPQTSEAVKQLEILLRVNPGCDRAPEALWILAACYAQEPKTADAARAAYERIVKDYRDSEYAERAQERLNPGLRKAGNRK